MKTYVSIHTHNDKHIEIPMSAGLVMSNENVVCFVYYSIKKLYDCLVVCFYWIHACVRVRVRACMHARACFTLPCMCAARNEGREKIE